MVKHNRITPVIVCLTLALVTVAEADSDVEWTFGNNGVIDYTLVSFEPDSADLGPVGAGDPTLNVMIGTRYEVTIVNPVFHPFEVIAKGGSAGGDTVLLSMTITGSMEQGPDINWVEKGGGVTEFTFTQGLHDAMTTSTQQPGYRCGIHVTTMRGNFNVEEQGKPPLEDPIPEGIVKGSMLTVSIEASGLEPDHPHPQHIHGHDRPKMDATCPPPEADTNGDGVIDIGEGGPYYGPAILPLEPFDQVDGSGNLSYMRTFEVDPMTFMPLEYRVIVLHGMITDQGYTTSLPVACGPIEDTASFVAELDPLNGSGVQGTATVILNEEIVVELETIARGMASPLDMVDPRDGTNRLFVVDQDGRIFTIQNGELLSKLFLDVTDRIVSPLGVQGSHDVNDFDERGLLGLALHPGFADPDSAGYQKLYTYTSEPDMGAPDFTTDPAPSSVNHQTVIAEWTVDGGDPNMVDMASRREIMRIDQPQFNHNAGMLVFGPADYLYIALGDGGGANDTGDGHGDMGNGQNINTVHGSILRIDPLLPSLTMGSGNAISSNGQYRIPWDNPFVGMAGVDEIFAYGFRNPFRFSYDCQRDMFIVADVGQNDIEEVDILEKGGNFGWNLREGSFAFNPDNGTVSEPGHDLPDTLIDPLAEYDHDEGIAIVGGFVYRGDEVPALRGKYVFGDYAGMAGTGRLFYMDLPNSEIREFVIGSDDRGLGLYLKGLGQDEEGEIYVLASPHTGPYGTDGVVLKIVDLCDAQLPGDIDNNCIVDFRDFALLADNWLGCALRGQGQCP